MKADCGRIAVRCVAVTLAGTLAVSCGAPPRPAPSSSPPASSAVPRTTVDVYYVIDTRGGVRLVREAHDVPRSSKVGSAIEAMVAGADDPDYATTWNPRTRVLGVSRDDHRVTIDLSAEARRANVGSAGAALMVQQLVYTVTSATRPTDRVSLLIEGQPAGELWGVVTWDEPVGREDPLGVRQLVQIDEPREGAEVRSPVVVVGEAAVFEAVLPWRVTDRSGRVAASGVARTGEGQRFAAFRFEVALKPGAYVIEITEDDPSAGAAGTLMVDSRTVVVRAG